MEIVPATVGAVSRAWDEQHLDLSAAAGQVGAAPTTGFSAPVSGTAARFLQAWQRHTAELGDEAETRADGLRTTIADFLATDRAVGMSNIVLRSYLTEVR